MKCESGIRTPNSGVWGFTDGGTAGERANTNVTGPGSSERSSVLLIVTAVSLNVHEIGYGLMDVTILRLLGIMSKINKNYL